MPEMSGVNDINNDIFQEGGGGKKILWMEKKIQT